MGWRGFPCSLSCASHQGRQRKGRGVPFARCSASPFACQGGVAATPRTEGGGSRHVSSRAAPRGGAHSGGGACGMRGRVCIYSPTLPLCTLQFVCAGVGRRERVEERVGGGGGYPPFFPRTPSKRGRRLLTCYFPLFVLIFTSKYNKYY